MATTPPQKRRRVDTDQEKDPQIEFFEWVCQNVPEAVPLAENITLKAGKSGEDGALRDRRASGICRLTYFFVQAFVWSPPWACPLAQRFLMSLQG